MMYSVGDRFEREFRAYGDGVRFNTLTLFYFDAGRINEYLDIDLDPDLSAPEYIALFIAVPDNFTFRTVMDGIGRAVVYGTRKTA